MNILVSYDVSTETKAGQRRLRRVANICKSYGHRVQKSVFECRVDQSTLLRLEHRLANAINEETDSLRIYRLREPREQNVTTYGLDTYQDMDDPLIA
jgi:CRISPR-associated protein Cas2